MHNRSDQFVKNVLREALSRASMAETDFRLGIEEPSTNTEDDVSAEIRAWFKEYEQNLRNEARKEGLQEGERVLLLRQLRARFGELPANAVARIEAAQAAELERWGERVIGAQTLTEVLGEPS